MFGGTWAALQCTPMSPPSTAPAPEPGTPASITSAPPLPFGEALRFWFKLGCVSFGGPAGQIAMMHQALVVERRWISEARFLHALNYCMLLPGPEAQQLATYLGWLLHRTWGGIVAGLLFILPALCLLIALSWLYMAHGQQPLVAALFYGIQPAVTAIVIHAAWRIGQRVLRHPLHGAIALAAFLALALIACPFPLVVLGAAGAGLATARWAPGAYRAAAPSASPHPAEETAALIDHHGPAPAHTRPDLRHTVRLLLAGALLWGVPMGGLFWLAGPDHRLTQMGAFFTQAALLTFGGAYAVLPYVQQHAVDAYQWLTASQMIDGLALGETTPGPLIMVVTFVGYVGAYTGELFGPNLRPLAGLCGALVATWFTFLPSFLFILIGGPWVERSHGITALQAPLTAITAAVVGVIANLALFFVLQVFWPGGLFDPWRAGLAALALLALSRGLGILRLLPLAALAGMLLDPASPWSVLR